MDIIGLIIILFLVAINGFFVAAEFSLVSIRISRLDELIQENKPLALLTRKAVVNLDNMLSVCQVGITIASLLLGWVGEEYLAHDLTRLFNYFGYDPPASFTVHGIAIAVAFCLITFMHIILGELLPKTIAIQSTESIALGVALPMWFFYYIFYPVTYFMNKITLGLLKLLRLQRTGDKYVHSPQELMIIIEEQSKSGRIDKEEMKLIKKTFNFSEHLAKDVMTHRLSVIGIESEATLDKLLPLIAEHNFSRYPVYEETLDKVLGVVHVQNYLQWLSKNPKSKKQKITSLMQDPIFVPESLSIEKVMQKLRLTNQHMAIVIDEYGGVAGLLTLEDIIEEIFGEIRDETDQDEKAVPDWNRNKPILIDGETEIDEIPEILEGVDPKDLEEVRTIAGLFLEQHEDMPKEGSIIQIPKGELKIKKMDGNKILSIQFTNQANLASREREQANS
ncbi:hemolysin family protein [Leptospira sp. GIMC2001]|uniref:hemolysin family protein n=1 Tax=Leptospira sp. GIMC2001 TaxID=1513297 RepID=UPI00234A9862|nr:hemolysin family protein [Leptospira sp. GIMC2001]WCL48872.1 hemolysin family protein [Leptospira sp. GIMC2001]